MQKGDHLMAILLPDCRFFYSHHLDRVPDWVFYFHSARESSLWFIAED